MGKKRGLGHISPDHAMANSILQWFDGNNLSGSAISQVFEARLDIVEDDQQALSVSLGNEINRAQAAEGVIQAALDTQEAKEAAYEASNNAALASEATTARAAEAVLSGNITALSSSISSSIAALSASIGAGGGINVDVSDDAELYFNGDTLMTNADVYISGSGNNLYLHGTNNQGIPAKFEFTIISGSTMISEVAHSDFGTEIDDPWFKFDGDTLLTHADIYVSGSNNYLYLNGTDDNGDYGVYYFDIVSGSVYIKQSGSV
tara:strand:- start:27 stop:812 length:786 start_codon:yes stop_codon:yes gene_type:complete